MRPARFRLNFRLGRPFLAQALLRVKGPLLTCMGPEIADLGVPNSPNRAPIPLKMKGVTSPTVSGWVGKFIGPSGPNILLGRTYWRIFDFSFGALESVSRANFR